ncbi:hypothetical protein AAVH_04345 [Aphelenchoides avenae]|nr:hypothetical protein AAVH_04345 [Aphelenchus avenae]
MGGSDSCAEASTSAKHQDEGKNGTSSIEAPNRHDFEKEIWRLNNNISRLNSQVKQYWSESRRTQMQQWRQENATLRNQLNSEKAQETTLADSVKQLQEQLQAKQREIHELEDADMAYKSLSVVQQKLNTAEERYNRQKFGTMREEQLQVNEINRLKRNLAKLTKSCNFVYL